MVQEISPVVLVVDLVIEVVLVDQPILVAVAEVQVP
jgi:hypothetical protein